MRKGKNGNKRKWFNHNSLCNNRLWNSLKISVFATNFAVGCFYVSYERHFVKKIQHLFYVLATYQRPIKRTRFFQLRAMFFNNEWNPWNQSTKQDNERKRSANETNLLTLTCCVCLLNSLYSVNVCVHWFQLSYSCNLLDLLLKQKDMIVSDNKRLFWVKETCAEDVFRCKNMNLQGTNHRWETRRRRKEIASLL